MSLLPWSRPTIMVALKADRVRRRLLAKALMLALLLAACGGSGIKADYILAEKLWQEKNYLSSARLFERVFNKDQKSKLGQQALYRAATTQMLFMRDDAEAARLFQKYIEIAPKGDAVHDARIQLGEIWYSRTQQYDLAIQHYRRMIRENPGAPENVQWLYRIGRAQYFLWQFEESIQTFDSLVAQSSSGSLVAEAAYQSAAGRLALASQPHSTLSDDEDPTGVSESTRPLLKAAIRAFEQVETRYPGTSAAKQAALALVSCYEEEGLWEEALSKAAGLGETYPVPQVVKIRIQRIKERLARRSASPKR